jgi:putative endopeptidase
VTRLRRSGTAIGWLLLGIVQAGHARVLPSTSVSTSVAVAAPATVPRRSGIETQYFDTSVRPQDDFYQYVNGKWLASTEIPADRPAYGAETKLYDDAQLALAGVIQDAMEDAKADPASDKAKIATLYQSFMDEARLEQLGSEPLADELARIQAVKSKRELPILVAHLQMLGVTTPFTLSIHLDGMDSRQYIPDLQQDGLGLPDRDYYLEDATTLRLILREYQAHIGSVLRLIGDYDAEREAGDIVALETRLARAQKNKADVRDPLKTYHRFDIGTADTIGSGFDWGRYLAAVGITERIEYLNVSEPEYQRAFARLMTELPLSTWKNYLRWHLVADYCPYLSRAYVDAGFAFYGTAMQGIPRNEPRWRRGIELVDQAIGQELGRLYVAKHFSSYSKQHAELLVENLLEAFRRDIDTLEWMSPETRVEALRKLARMSVKIGYPDRWRDYSALKFREDDLVGNVMRANAFEFHRNLEKLGKPLDRASWDTTPQSVNAFYSPQLNEIVFPAAILQSPFFDAGVDDAANYGGIGMVVGHEISHAFDDEGSQYDSDGRVRDWWSAADHERFAARTAPLVRQYGGFTPMRGRTVDGELTLHENVADNAGLAIAHKAYLLSLNDSKAPVIDGLTGEQRFFMGFAQAWREKLRDNLVVRMLQSDPHAVSFVRVIGTLMNQSAFDETFQVQPGDRMYVAADRRVVIW